MSDTPPVDPVHYVNSQRPGYVDSQGRWHASSNWNGNQIPGLPPGFYTGATTAPGDLGADNPYGYQYLAPLAPSYTGVPFNQTYAGQPAPYASLHDQIGDALGMSSRYTNAFTWMNGANRYNFAGDRPRTPPTGTPMPQAPAPPAPTAQPIPPAITPGTVQPKVAVDPNFPQPPNPLLNAPAGNTGTYADPAQAMSAWHALQGDPVAQYQYTLGNPAMARAWMRAGLVDNNWFNQMDAGGGQTYQAPPSAALTGLLGKGK